MPHARGAASARVPAPDLPLHGLVELPQVEELRPSHFLHLHRGTSLMRNVTASMVWTWKPRPASGQDCCMCATFARQRHVELPQVEGLRPALSWKNLSKLERLFRSIQDVRGTNFKTRSCKSFVNVFSFIFVPKNAKSGPRATPDFANPPTRTKAPKHQSFSAKKSTLVTIALLGVSGDRPEEDLGPLGGNTGGRRSWQTGQKRSHQSSLFIELLAFNTRYPDHQNGSDKHGAFLRGQCS